MALKNFTQFTPRTALSATDYLVGYRDLDEIRTDLDSMSLGVSAQLISKGFLPGTIVGSVKRTSYQYTIVPGSNLNAVSGNDNNGRLLSYTVGQIEVYRNGSHLVDSQDYIASNTTQIRNLSTLNFGDIVEVVALSGTGATLQTSLTGFIGNLVQQNYRYSVGPGNTIVAGNTVISGPDDFGANLLFSTNCFQIYLNGSHLVRDYDYSSYNLGNSFTLAAPVATGDTVDVVSLSACFASSLNTVSAFAGISRLNAGDRVTLSNSTGNVTVSSQTCISDFPASDWTNGSHISRWGTLQAYLSGVAASNTSAPSNVYPQYFGSINTQGSGLVVHPNGKIYIGPSGTSLVRVLDPSNDSITVISSGYVSNQNQGASLHPNGRIYSHPYFGSLIRFIDPSNNSVGVAGTLVHGTAGDANLGGMTLAPNGKFYIFPYNQSPYAIYSIVNVFDPATSVVSPIHTVTGSVISGMYTANASTLAPNGKIYAFPVSTAQSIVLKIDPDNNTVTNLRTFSRAAGAVFTHQNGVYITSGTLMFLLDPSNDTIATVGTFLATGGSTVYSVLAPNGKIYFTPFTGTSMAFYDPVTNLGGTLSQITDSFVSAYAGGTLAPNGAIYCAPFAATQILKLNFLNNNNFDLNTVTNPMIAT